GFDGRAGPGADEARVVGGEGPVEVAEEGVGAAVGKGDRPDARAGLEAHLFGEGGEDLAQVGLEAVAAGLACQHDRGAGIVTAAEDDPGAGAADGAVEGGAVGAHPAVDRERGIHAGAGGEGDGGVQDRKSTRLNSSHVKSSYAVFCLKKKNTS